MGFQPTLAVPASPKEHDLQASPEKLLEKGDDKKFTNVTESVTDQFATAKLGNSPKSIASEREKRTQPVQKFESMKETSAEAVYVDKILGEKTTLAITFTELNLLRNRRLQVRLKYIFLLVLIINRLIRQLKEQLLEKTRQHLRFLGRRNTPGISCLSKMNALNPN